MLDSGKVLLYGTTEEFLNSNMELVKQFVSKGMHRSIELKVEVAKIPPGLVTRLD